MVRATFVVRNNIREATTNACGPKTFSVNGAENEMATSMLVANVTTAVHLLCLKFTTLTSNIGDAPMKARTIEMSRAATIIWSRKN